MEKDILKIIQKYVEFDINLDSNIILLGVNSLKMMMIKWDIERKYNIEITYDDLLKLRTVKDFVELVKKYKESKYGTN